MSTVNIHLDSHLRHEQRILTKGEVSLYGWPPVYFVWIQLLCLRWMNNSFACLVKSKPVKQVSDTFLYGECSLHWMSCLLSNFPPTCVLTLQTCNLMWEPLRSHTWERRIIVGLSLCHWKSINVTRFSESMPLWWNLKSLWQFLSLHSKFLLLYLSLL